MIEEGELLDSTIANLVSDVRRVFPNDTSLNTQEEWRTVKELFGDMAANRMESTFGASRYDIEPAHSPNMFIAAYLSPRAAAHYLPGLIERNLLYADVPTVAVLMLLGGMKSSCVTRAYQTVTGYPTNESPRVTDFSPNQRRVILEYLAFLSDHPERLEDADHADLARAARNVAAVVITEP